MTTVVYPDLGAVASAAQLREIVGALLMTSLVVAVLVVVACAATWAIASGTGNYRVATRARLGMVVACGTALLAGAGSAIVNFLLQVGATI
ncbi:steroid 5-alpha reductase family enzyme [Microbacterium terrae]|uniref:Integral membrane protein n=1 Tax=Microbacterium terrae TaxID=69369 RepID=A0A0M2GVM6_9MICO|nr:DUF6112 family protein [Microbacterium terrae]KJL37572.1 hypothetical protein RS81_03329 [Microbacterium terrae]MBP1076403.1 steroid 5-alpha reductase family enzyme [Microbacterium terrae]GLJ97229.1 hypothetical protein GCM10017594_04260 [Microbacterium terrae]